MRERLFFAGYLLFCCNFRLPHYYSKNRWQPSFRRRPESRGGAVDSGFRGSAGGEAAHHFHPRMWPAGAWAITIKIAGNQARTSAPGPWIPAYAGIQVMQRTPAFAGIQVMQRTPAFAGVTVGRSEAGVREGMGWAWIFTHGPVITDTSLKYFTRAFIPPDAWPQS